jgi:hypothetical protein
MAMRLTTYEVKAETQEGPVSFKLDAPDSETAHKMAEEAVRRLSIASSPAAEGGPPPQEG